MTIIPACRGALRRLASAPVSHRILRFPVSRLRRPASPRPSRSAAAHRCRRAAAAMKAAFGASDADGAWDWKTRLRRLRGGDRPVPAQIRRAPCAPSAGSPAALLADAREGRRLCFRRRRGAPRKARPSSSSRRRSARLRRQHRRRDHRRPTSCSNRRPAPACSPSLPSSPAPRSS